jgi:hypothetical protein
LKYPAHQSILVGNEFSQRRDSMSCGKCGKGAAKVKKKEVKKKK